MAKAIKIIRQPRLQLLAIVAVALAVFAGMWTSQAQADLGPTFNSINGHYYSRADTPLSWADAKAAAEAQTFIGVQGHLVTVTSASESAWLVANGLTINGGYIGAFQRLAALSPMAAESGSPASRLFIRTGTPRPVSPITAAATRTRSSCTQAPSHRRPASGTIPSAVRPEHTSSSLTRRPSTAWSTPYPYPAPSAVRVGSRWTRMTTSG